MSSCGFQEGQPCRLVAGDRDLEGLKLPNQAWLGRLFIERAKKKEWVSSDFESDLRTRSVLEIISVLFL